MNSSPDQSAPRPGAARRSRLICTTLGLGSALPAAVIALGPAVDLSTGLNWAFLLAGPILACLFLLAATYETATRPSPPPPATVLTLAGALVLTYAVALATPVVIFQRLSPATGRLVELSRHPVEELSREAMTAAAPRRRLEAALGLYLRTGRPAMFLDMSGSPAIFRPDGEEAQRLTFPRWLAGRPGAVAWERHLLALTDAGLILTLLAALPLVIRHAGAGAADAAATTPLSPHGRKS